MEISPLSTFQIHLRSQTLPIRNPLLILRPPSKFLRLPFEIRLNIYRHAFSGTSTLRYKMALPIVCKQVFDESYTMALSSSIRFRSSSAFVRFWRRTEPSRRAHVKNAEIVISRAMDIHRIPMDLHTRCAGLEGECQGLRLESLVLAVIDAMDPIEMLQPKGVTRMIRTLAEIDVADTVVIADYYGGGNRFMISSLCSIVRPACRERWLAAPLRQVSGEVIQKLVSGSGSVDGISFTTRESLRRSGLEIEDDLQWTVVTAEQRVWCSIYKAD